MSPFFYHFSFDIQKYFFQRKQTRHSFFNFLFFIQNKTSSYSGKETEWKIIFCTFSLEIPSTFLTSKKEFFRILMTSKNLLIQNMKSFFSIFSYRKSQHTCICFIINLQKKHENRGVPSRVLNPDSFAKGMAPPKIDSLSFLHAWFRLHIG